MSDATDNRPPAQLDGADVLCYASLAGIEDSGETFHLKEGQKLHRFEKLVIASYSDSEGVYLFYCNDRWESQTDTYHDFVIDAKDQAEFEYPDVTLRWIEFKQPEHNL
jgi:hypothetical protein